METNWADLCAASRKKVPVGIAELCLGHSGLGRSCAEIKKNTTRPQENCQTEI
jgi:hypothetical protein